MTLYEFALTGERVRVCQVEYKSTLYDTAMLKAETAMLKVETSLADQAIWLLLKNSSRDIEKRVTRNNFSGILSLLRLSSMLQNLVQQQQKSAFGGNAAMTLSCSPYSVSNILRLYNSFRLGFNVPGRCLSLYPTRRRLRASVMIRR